MSLVVGKRLAGVVLAGAVLAGVSGCGNAVDVDQQGFAVKEDLSSALVRLPDGRAVACIRAYNGGVACDWEHAK